MLSKLRMIRSLSAWAFVDDWLYSISFQMLSRVPMRSAWLFLQMRKLAILLLTAGVTNLHAQVYIAPFSDAQWSSKAGSFSCELTQKITGFGNVRLMRKTGAAEVLEITGTNLRFGKGDVRIESVPPPWRSETTSGDLGRITEAENALKITGPQIDSITYHLKQGSNVMFTGASLRVGLEARNFSGAFARYQACVKNLIPHTFGQLSRTQLNYAATDENLASSNKVHLDKIIRYMKADKSVLGITVDAHADKQPTPGESEALSKRQAELVAAYLGEKGIPSGQIKARWHGDKFPIASNQTKPGQSKNRRVTLRLENAESRAALEKKKSAAIKAAEQKALEEPPTENAIEQHAASEISAKKTGKAAKSSSGITPAELENIAEEHDFFTPNKKPDAVRPK